MAKATSNTTKPAPKAAAKPATKTAEKTDESKLDALVQAEEEINAESTKTDDAKTPEPTADKTVKLTPKVQAETTDKEADDAEPVVVDNSSDAKPVLIEAGTEGNLKLNSTNVDSGTDTAAVHLQYDDTVTDEQVARVAEMEAAQKSGEVNNRLPNKTAPEQVDSTVKLNTMIARATSIDTDKIDERQGVHSTMADRAARRESRLIRNSAARDKRTLRDPSRNSFSSTETLQLDEIAVPVEGRRPSRMQEQIARQSRSANPIMGVNSTQPIISKERPINVFKAVAQAKNNDGKQAKLYMVDGATTMSGHLQKTLGLSEEKLTDGGFLNKLVDMLDEYVKKMNPSVPKTAADVTEQQKTFIGTLKVVLDQSAATGVVALQIIEQYFRVYRNAAMRGELPFRAFNEVSPDENRLTNLIYAIQEIALYGREQALQNVSIKKLKESVDSETGQLIIVSYLRQG